MSRSEFPNVNQMSYDELIDERDRCLSVMQAAMVAGEHDGYASVEQLLGVYEVHMSYVASMLKSHERTRHLNEEELLSTDFPLSFGEHRAYIAIIGMFAVLFGLRFTLIPGLGFSVFAYITGGAQESTDSNGTDIGLIIFSFILLAFLSVVTYLTLRHPQSVTLSLVKQSKEAVHHLLGGFEDMTTLQKAVRIAKFTARRQAFPVVLFSLNIAIVILFWNVVVIRVFTQAYNETGDADKARLSSVKVTMKLAKKMIFVLVPILTLGIISLMLAGLFF